MNGFTGIGTGWSTNGPNFDVIQVGKTHPADPMLLMATVSKSDDPVTTVEGTVAFNTEFFYRVKKHPRW